MTQIDDHDYRYTFSVASLLIAEHLAEREPDELRRTRKQAVAQEKWALLRDAFAADLGTLHGYGGTGPAMRQLTGALEQRTSGWPPQHRWMLLIDLLTSDAYAPYALKVTITDLREVVAEIAAVLGLADEHAELLDAWHEMLRPLRPARWKTVISPGGPTTSALLTSGLDPATAAALAVAAGLDGPAATPHGIALLGGGCLSLGGVTFAAGTWLLDPSIDTRGVDTGDGGPLHGVGLPCGAAGLLALGPAQARVELVKLELYVKLVVRAEQFDTATSEQVADALSRVIDDLRAQLDLERDRNDDDAPRISDIQATLHSMHAAQTVVQSAVGQMAQEQAA